jgi:DNA repair photolyase
VLLPVIETRAGGTSWTGDAPPLPLLEPCEPLEGWGLSTYERCAFRCRYCITGVQGASVPRVEPAVLTDELRRELAEHRPIRVGVGLFCDAYPPVEAELGLTRRALEVLIEDEDLDIRVITKGLTVRRDVDLLRGRPRTGVNVSLCSTREDLIRPFDGLAPTPQERLALLHDLAADGVNVELALSPWIPGVTDTTALIDAVDPSIPIRITPLRVRAPKVIDTAFGRQWDQEEVNAAFEREFREIGERRNVYWSPVAPLDGSPPHISVLVSRPGRGDRMGLPIGDDAPPRDTATAG